MLFSKLAILVGLVAPISGFLDSGSVYCNQKLPSKYIIDSTELMAAISGQCSSLPSSIDKLKVYRVKDLSTAPAANFIKHVQYDSMDDLDRFSGLCGLSGTVETIDRFEDIEFSDNHLVLVQQIPSFQKRDIYDEVAEDLKAAESMAAENDMPVSIFDGDSGSSQSKKTKGLFNNYQFFSPGIFSCLIVSFILLFVLSTALSWISSIEITYQSFEKQIDFEKKNE
ncbi:hypothetical protein PSN45_001444 [Yamadazyma tenuis]|uniref:Protein BIG1 n=1 Tax=Candida tenuis (strain ATCC 10573 / BCRC 21748 / CBS 615 / JCM 9827 / NBRC 10315 / NRRL Y-1498 / VKM Y-70) TaxID=590646 RepID=G3BC18_CANTC|nr:uncharacterized protein CANTEDRAFT_96203 [Yamadazyma tenuis ATCC 10573]EGV60761.1 hypothetical protein CANTEDRAFT_96203 [Yamadazyma tenuis ATCC 10573]WEJ93967.1 hypothetical protein PSN45_001444 [Yamadazyma tenuis]